MFFSYEPLIQPDAQQTPEALMPTQCLNNYHSHDAFLMRS